MSRPGIKVVPPYDDTFKWESDGWFAIKRRHTPEAQALMAKADAAIEAATDVEDAIKLLREAGFKVWKGKECG